MMRHKSETSNIYHSLHNNLENATVILEAVIILCAVCC